MIDKFDRNELNELVLKTVAYSDMFNYPLTLDELSNDLPYRSVEKSDLENLFGNLDGLAGKIQTRENYVFMGNRGELLSIRTEREKFTNEMLARNEKRISRVCNLPWVRTVALSGSAAFGNSSDGDDIDLFVIVEPNRVWLVDFYNLFVVRIFRERILRKHRIICMNYIIDSVSMPLRNHDFFTAHQVVHLKPLYDEGCWDEFIKSNKWAWEHFPSANPRTIAVTKKSKAKALTETLLNFTGAGILNSLVYLVRGRRLRGMRKSGILKGEYTLRTLKTNDSRSGLIASLRMEMKLARLNGNANSIENLKDKSCVTETDNLIPDCIPESYRSKIDSFLLYLNSSKTENCLTPDEVLNLPFGVISDKALWKKRASNFKSVMRIIRSLAPDNAGPLLDLGAGNCWLSRHLLENGYRTISVDPSVDPTTGLKAGDIFEEKRNMKLDRVRGISQSLPFVDACCNGVIASGAFHYTDDIERSLSEIARVLDSDGWAIIYDSPVFRNRESGEKMVESKIKEFSSPEEYNLLEYKPIWYIDLPAFTEQAYKAGFHVELIQTRTRLQRIADKIKNRIQSNRDWAEHPIIVLRKIDNDTAKAKVNPIQILRYLYYKQSVESKLVPGREFTVDKIRLKVPHDVFHPIPYDSSRILLRYLKFHFPHLNEKLVLDMGTGSGIHAIQCAIQGANVTAIDINESAIETSKANAELNGMGDKIEFHTGDLFSPIGDKRFDLILFNPPYYEGEIENVAQRAWIDTNSETLNRFIGQVSDHLNPDGFALLIVSDRMDIESIRETCEISNIVCETVRRRRVWDECYFILRLSRGESHEC